jgi:hypothetical protein
MSNNFCTTFDLLQQSNLDLGKLITDCCLSGVVSRKSVIMPSSATIKKIKALKTIESKRNNLMDYILLFKYTPEQLTFAAKNDKKIKVINGKTYSVKKVDEKTFKLNDKKITVKGNVKETYYLFKASSELKPFPSEHKTKPENKVNKEKLKDILAEKGGSKRKSKRKSKNTRKIKKGINPIFKRLLM